MLFTRQPMSLGW